MDADVTVACTFSFGAATLFSCVYMHEVGWACNLFNNSCVRHGDRSGFFVLGDDIVLLSVSMPLVFSVLVLLYLLWRQC
jgi:hypothetical protein